MPIDKKNVVSRGYRIVRVIAAVAGLLVVFLLLMPTNFLVLLSGLALTHILETRMIVDSLYVLLAGPIVAAYLAVLVVLKIWWLGFGRHTRRVIRVRWRRVRTIPFKIVILALSAVLVTIWLWADIVDGIFAALFVVLAHVYRRRFLNPRHIHGWILLFINIGFLFLVNCDKLTDSKDLRTHDFYATEWLIWTSLACYMIHVTLMRRYRPWKWLIAAVLIWLLPIVELPGAITRQFVGWGLTGHMENLYFTKIRPDRVYALELPRCNWVRVFRRRSGLSYTYEEKVLIIKGGGVSGWVQAPRSPRLLVRLRAALDTR